jgi:pyruvate formate lyase activating enzyme
VRAEEQQTYKNEEILAFLRKRLGILDGVAITGGEPTLMSGLYDFIKEVKEMGYSVKLDTNGTRPEVLKRLVNDGLVDYVAMDIKNSPEKYAKTISNSEFRIPNFSEQITRSVDILMQGSVDFEFRTTLTRELHSPEDMEAIGRWIGGEEKYFLQTYRDEGDLIEGGFTAYSREETEELLGIVKKYLPNALIRG